MKKIRDKQMKLYCLLCAVFCVGCSSSSPSEKETEAEERIQVALIEKIPEVNYRILKKGGFSREMLSNGIITAQYKVDVKWGVSDVILKVFVKNGDKVMKNQLLAEADPEKSRLSYQQAELNLMSAKLEMQSFYIGQGYLLSDTANIPQETKQLASIKSGYAQAELAFRQAGIALRETSLRAPFTGIVANLNDKPYYKSVQGETFCTLLGNSSMEIVFSVMENEVEMLQLNEPVVVSLYSQEGKERAGRISDINPIVSEKGLIEVKAIITDIPSNWFDGMKMRVKIRKNMPDKLVVPKEAVVIRDNRQVVFTIKDGLAYWNYVSIGIENSTNYTIDSGLSEGDSIIVKGNLNLAHLSPIVIIPEI